MMWEQIQVPYQFVNSKVLNLREMKQDAVLNFLGRYGFCFYLQVFLSPKVDHAKITGEISTRKT